MYWIYLVIFIVIIFVPDIITSGAFLFPEEKLEVIVLFALGSMGFALFVIKERHFIKSKKEKSKTQEDLARASKDLANSYSYIGEINRKLDIIKNISHEITETLEFTPLKIRSIYESIVEGLRVLIGDDNFTLRFVDMESIRTRKEESGKKNISFKVSNRDLVRYENQNAIFAGSFTVIRSSNSVDGVRVFAITEAKGNQAVENFDFIKILLCQALFVFILEERSKKGNK